MTDHVDELLREWLRDRGTTDRVAVDRLAAATSALPARRRRNRFTSIAAAAAAVLALGLAAIAVVPQSSHPARGPGPLPPDPVAFAGDPRLAPCGATIENALDIFEMARARDYRLHLPAMGLSPELDVDAPAFVVVYRARQPFGISGAAPPPGQTWPPEPSLALGHHDVCVLVGSDPSTAAMNVYGDVDIAGLMVAVNQTEPSLPARPSSSPTGTPAAATTPEPTPIWALDLSGQLGCDGPVASIGGDVSDGVARDVIGATPDEAVAAFLAPPSPYGGLPNRGFTKLHVDAHWASFIHVADQRAKAILVVSDLDQGRGPGWAVVGLRACDPSEFEPSIPLTYAITIWTDAAGTRVPTTAIFSGPGPGHCGWESATFLWFADVTFIRDPHGLSGLWTRPRFDPDSRLPTGARDTGYRSAAGDLWTVVGGDAYLVTGGQVERWPRLDPAVGCT